MPSKQSTLLIAAALGVGGYFIVKQYLPLGGSSSGSSPTSTGGQVSSGGGVPSSGSSGSSSSGYSGGSGSVSIPTQPSGSTTPTTTTSASGPPSCPMYGSFIGEGSNAGVSPGLYVFTTVTGNGTDGQTKTNTVTNGSCQVKARYYFVSYFGHWIPQGSKPDPSWIKYSWASAPTLQYGDSGYLVRDLQLALWSLGFNPLPGAVNPADGQFGSKTLAAVKSFQSWAATHLIPGMSVDGIVGPQTDGALNSALGSYGGSWYAPNNVYTSTTSSGGGGGGGGGLTGGNHITTG